MQRNQQTAILGLLCCALALVGCGSDPEADPTGPLVAPVMRPQLHGD